MNSWRTPAAWLLGLLAVVLVVVAWLVSLFAVAFGMAVDAGQSGDAHPLYGFLIPVLIASAIAAAAMYFSIRSLGRWAAESPDNTTATVVALVVTGVFTAGVVALLAAEVVGYLRN